MRHASCVMIPMRSHPSSGAVLFMVLILTTVMYLVASTLLLITMTEIQLAGFGQRSTQAFYAAESSLALGLSKLRNNANYRSDTSDTIDIGTNTAMLTAEFYDGTNDGNGHYLKALKPSLYRLVLRGIGMVPGLHAATKRTVERDLIIKPFALFARNNLTLDGGCAITGNIHGNSTVTIETETAVTGDVTSNGNINNNGTITGVASDLEPKLDLPALLIDGYFPKYTYNGNEYEAEPLAYDIVLLDDEDDPPAPSIHLYSGFPSTDNPAGVFYFDSEIMEPYNAFRVEGTVIIPQPGMLAINGAVTITPVDNFPALISRKNLDITLIGGLEDFSSSIKKSEIQGLIYVQGNVSITGNNTTGEVIIGSLLGHNITITGDPTFQVTYDPAIISDPPPGVDLIEFGEWREIVE